MPRATTIADHSQVPRSMLNTLRAAEQKAYAIQARADRYRAQLEALRVKHRRTIEELESLKSPAAASAEEIIARCSQSGPDTLAVQFATAKLPMHIVEQRLRVATDVRDIAKATGIEADILMQHLDSPARMIRSAVKAVKDEVQGAVSAHLPDQGQVYQQMNQTL